MTTSTPALTHLQAAMRSTFTRISYTTLGGHWLCYLHNKPLFQHHLHTFRTRFTGSKSTDRLHPAELAPLLASALASKTPMHGFGNCALYLEDICAQVPGTQKLHGPTHCVGRTPEGHLLDVSYYERPVSAHELATTPVLGSAHLDSDTQVHTRSINGNLFQERSRLDKETGELSVRDGYWFRPVEDLTEFKYGGWAGKKLTDPEHYVYVKKESYPKLQGDIYINLVLGRGVVKFYDGAGGVVNERSGKADLSDAGERRRFLQKVTHLLKSSSHKGKEQFCDFLETFFEVWFGECK